MVNGVPRPPVTPAQQAIRTLIQESDARLQQWERSGKPAHDSGWHNERLTNTVLHSTLGAVRRAETKENPS